METKNKRKHFGKEIINDVLKMKEQGMTNYEISQFYGFNNKYVIKDLLKRYRRKQRKLEAEAFPQNNIYPNKQLFQNENEKDNEITRLKMENELLRSFLYETERWNVKA